MSTCSLSNIIISYVLNCFNSIYLITGYAAYVLIVHHHCRIISCSKLTLVSFKHHSIKVVLMLQRQKNSVAQIYSELKFF